tara:strand:- start:1755 stop:3395 length:1641 start_codon:yes stop_codon:yes gene_type:complete
MYQLTNLIESLKNCLKSFDINEEIDLRICNEDRYQFQINNLVKYTKEPAIEKIISSFAEIIEKEKIIEEFQINEKRFINLKIDLQIFSYTYKNIREVIKTKKTKNIIIDYGGPNIGKPLHVGHLRSLNIGRSLYQINTLAGNNVISDIHMGDWGMPIAQIICFTNSKKINLNDLGVDALEEIYPISSALYIEDDNFKTTAQDINKKLNTNDKDLVEKWKSLKNISIDSLNKILGKMNHNFDLMLGESDVNYLIPEMIQGLVDKNKIIEDDGAYIANINVDPKILVTKSDGSYLYLTTDLATVIHRSKKYEFDSVIYVVDKRQSLHFKQLFECVRYFELSDADFKHVSFGTVNDSDGNPLKTRDGGTKKLEALFNETYEHIKKINKNIDQETINKLSNTVLTFSDLITNRKTDYKFDLEKFSNINGKTGIYVQYAQVRAKKLLSKSKLDQKQKINPKELDKKDIRLLNSLMKFEIYFKQAINNNEPHFLADYLYEISNEYNSIYQGEKILQNKSNVKMINKIIITKYFVEYSLLLMESLGIFPVDEM